MPIEEVEQRRSGDTGECRSSATVRKFTEHGILPQRHHDVSLEISVISLSSSEFVGVTTLATHLLKLVIRGLPLFDHFLFDAFKSIASLGNTNHSVYSGKNVLDLILLFKPLE